MLSRMRRSVQTLILVSTLFFLFPSAAALPQARTQTVALDVPADLKLRNVKAEPATYKGRKALRVTGAAAAERISRKVRKLC